jgi:hypothetical protein
MRCRVTLDLTIAVATVLGEVNPGLTFCYVSAQGADSSGRGRFMWARVRGETENRLLQMPFPALMFRPGYIQPWKGVPSKTKAVRAMIRAATIGCSNHVLEARDFNALAFSA